MMRLDMHDYTPQAKAYWWLMSALGAVAFTAALWQVAPAPGIVQFEILFGAAFCALNGLFPVRIPGSKISGGAAEVLLFLLLLEFGPAAATIAAAAEAATISWRTSKRWTSRLGSPAIAALAMYACGTAFELVVASVPSDASFASQAKFTLLLAFALAYFATNTLLMAALIKLKRSEPLRPFALLREHGWLGLVYMASASLAQLCEAAFRQFSVSAVLAAAPLIAVLLSSLHVYFKRAEDRERLQAERIANAERAAADAALHLQELQESEDRFQSAFAHAAVGMVLVSAEGRVLQANASLARLLGRTETDLAGASIDDIFHADDSNTLHAELRALLGGDENAFVTEVRCRHSSGVEVWVSLSGSFFVVKPPLSRCINLQLQDITARRRAETRLQHIANHDSLTDLPNRNYFMEQLAKALAAGAKHPDRRFAVLFLDFDRFKLVNDSLGHGAGDELLRGVGQRLRAHVHSTDLVARFGGDEFAILVQGAKVDQEAIRLAQRIQDVIAEPVYLNGVAISTTASIGITISTFGYDSPEQVIRDADTAMYRAKSQGKARFAVFDSALHSEVANRLWLEGELRRALTHSQLTLAFQPIFDLATRALLGFEALARWTHPERGAIAPDTFVRIAEETGLIVPLGTWALRAACGTLARWRADDPRVANLHMHVNVSGVQLAQPDFPQVVRQVLESSGLHARQLVIELTESVLIEKRSIAVPHLQELRALGVGVSIDDFGTGFSSFSMLPHLPIDEIKIDRTFVEQLGVDERSEAVVATMLALGCALDTPMLAEGIETEEQLARLTAMGCARGQGFLLGRPLAVDAAEALVKASSAAPVHLAPPAAILADGTRARPSRFAAAPPVAVRPPLEAPRTAEAA